MDEAHLEKQIMDVVQGRVGTLVVHERHFDGKQHLASLVTKFINEGQIEIELSRGHRIITDVALSTPSDSERK